MNESRPVFEEDKRRTNSSERILAEASRLFLERGYRGTSMSEIGNRVGITSPALYWHFGSKEDILYAFLENQIKRLFDRVRDALGAGTPPEELRKFVRTHVMYHLEDLEASQTYGLLHESDFLGALSPEHRVRIETLLRGYRYMCQRILIRGLDEGYFADIDPTVAAFAILTMGEDVVSWFKHSGRLSPDQVADMYADLAVRMLSNSGTRPSLEN